MHIESVNHPAHWILSLELLKLDRGVLVEELVYGQPSSTNTNLNLFSHNLDTDAFGAKLINAFLLSHEHNLQFLAIRVVVNIFGQFLINHVALDWDIDSNSALEVDDVLAERLNLSLVILHLLEHL